MSDDKQLPAHPELVAKLLFHCGEDVQLRRLKKPRREWKDLTQMEREMMVEAASMMMATIGQRGVVQSFLVEAARNLVVNADRQAAKTMEAQGAADDLAQKAADAGISVIGEA